MLLGILIVVVCLILFVVWYCVACTNDNTDMTSIANESSFVLYPYTRKKCQELLLHNTDTRKYQIAVVSLSIGDRKFAQITRKILTKYCEKHGYDLHYYTEPLDFNYKTTWQKILAFRAVMLLNKYDYVMWIDDDIIIKNMDIKVEQFISLSDKPIITSHDVFKNQYDFHINTGTFIFKHCEMSKEILNKWIEGYHNVFDGKYQTTPYYDQNVFIYLYFKQYHPHIEVLPHGVMQTIHGRYESWDGEFATHMAGVKTSDRNKITERYYNKT